MFASKISLLALALALSSTQALAGSTSGNFQSTASLSASCTISMADINFGVIAVTGFQTKSVDITVMCNKSLGYDIGINAGNSGDFSSRTMKGSKPDNTDQLVYVLNREYGAPWNDSNAVYHGVGTGDTQKVKLGISILNQYVQPDNYSDDLVVSVRY